MHNIVLHKLHALTELCAKYHIKRLELFGSAATVEGADVSIGDIDFLVEFTPTTPKEHCDRYFGFHEELESLFERKVDLVESKAMKNPYFIRRVNESRKLLYAAA